MGETLAGWKRQVFGWEALVVSDGSRYQKGEPRQVRDLKMKVKSQESSHRVL